MKNKFRLATTLYYIFFCVLILIACKPKANTNIPKTGNYSGEVRYGNFADTIIITITKDTTHFNAFFTSLNQNANSIPFQDISVEDDSLFCKLQSDLFTYHFKNKWVNNNNKIKGTLLVDTVSVTFTLNKIESKANKIPKPEELTFKSNDLTMHGSLWKLNDTSKQGLVIVTSSGNNNRSASRAEAVLFAQLGYTCFHYDKRGTGLSQGDWESASIEELALDDINAIRFFSKKTGIPLSNIGIKGSSQGATKIPYLLNKLNGLKYGIAVSCPGSTLLESDLNYWKNNNKTALGNSLEDAASLQKKVFQYIAGEITEKTLTKTIENSKEKSWFSSIWIPDLTNVKIDKKLSYSPLPHFKNVKQPILIIQGTKDKIIPPTSDKIIANVLKKANNKQYKIVLLEDASHAMTYVGESDFPYWQKLHSDYINTISDWILETDL